MRWERLFADLEARLEAEDRAAVEADVADLVRAERSRLTLRDRLRAHVGETLNWSLIGAEPPLTGRLKDLGADWVLLGTVTGDMLVPVGALRSIGGLTRASAPESGEVARRLGLGVVLRGLARDRAPVSVRLVGDHWVTGTVDRVGADHLDLAVHPLDEPRRRSVVRSVHCLPFSGLIGVTVH